MSVCHLFIICLQNLSKKGIDKNTDSVYNMHVRLIKILQEKEKEKMKIIFSNGTTEIIKEFDTNMSMTLDAIIEHFGEIINDANDERFSDDGDNVIIDGERFWYEDIEKSWNENTDIED